jgi:Asp-tRNA(Asn)/Glu-tRNA(Gln) amidotransferase A subunit family amidase
VLAGEPGGLSPVDLKGVRIGVPRERFWEDLSPEVRACSEQALQVLTRAGVQLVEVSFPGLLQANDEAGFPIALYEFVRDMRSYLAESGHGVTIEDVVARIGSPDVAAVCQPLLAGGAIPAEVYASALAARQRLQAIYADGFRDTGVSALVFPTTPRTASLIGEDDTVELNGQHGPVFPTFIRNTDAGSNASLPGVSLPIGFSGALPMGLALDAPFGQDRNLLALAAAVEALFPPARPINL